MAVYTNLAIDCANNGAGADNLLNLYSQLALTTVEFGSVSCKIEHIKPNRHWGQPHKYSVDAANWHTLCVSPTGVNNGNLLSESLIVELRSQIYEPLKIGPPFRSAWFGCEAQNALGRLDWLKILQRMNTTGDLPDMPGLILASDLVENESVEARLKTFSPGYLQFDPESA